MRGSLIAIREEIERLTASHDEGSENHAPASVSLESFD
jgi:hypothetical protein